jgi:hypothetical protein
MKNMREERMAEFNRLLEERKALHTQKNSAIPDVYATFREKPLDLDKPKREHFYSTANQFPTI